MAPKDDLLNNFSLQKQTKTEALSILRLAQTKTGAGSGRDIRSLSVGLPAVCAYLASQKCNTTEVSKQAAQGASCLKPSDFSKVLQIVQAILDEFEDRVPSVLSLKSLHREYGIEVAYDRLDPFFKAAGNTLLQINEQFKPELPDVRCAMFFWVCTAIKAKGFPTSKKAFVEENEITYKTFSTILEQLNIKCISLRKRILEEMKRPASPAKASVVVTPRRSPVKRPLRELPSRGSPRKLLVVTALPLPEEEDAIVEDLLPETPTKKRKLDDSPSKSPTKPLFPSTPSSSHLNLEKQVPNRILRSRTASPVKAPERAPPIQPPVAEMNVDVVTDVPSSSEGEDETPPPLRRFRPINLDRKQWYSRDVRLARIWKHSEKHKQAMKDQYGHPFEQYSPAV